MCSSVGIGSLPLNLTVIFPGTSSKMPPDLRGLYFLLTLHIFARRAGHDCIIHLKALRDLVPWPAFPHVLSVPCHV